MKRSAMLGAVVVLCVLIAAGAAFLGTETPPRTTLEMAPEGTTFVAHLDVAAIMSSPLWQAYVHDDEGMSRIERLCGASPLESVHTADVYVVGSGESPLAHLAFVARGPLDLDRLGTCVRQVVEDDGGGIHEVRIEGVRAIASDRGDGRAAFLAADTVVGGDETLVRELIHLDHGSAHPMQDATLSRLYALAVARHDIALAAIVPDAWRGAIGHALEGAPGLAPLTGSDAVALGATLAHGGVGLTVVIACARESEARRLAEAARTAIDTALDDPLVRLSAAGMALRRIDLEPRGADLVATLDLDQDALEDVVALIRERMGQTRIPVLDGPAPAPAPIEE